MKNKVMVISGGGTGGHLFPALAVGRRIIQKDPSVRITFVGSRREIERNIMEKEGIPFIPLRVEALKGRKLGILKALLLLPLCLIQSFWLILKLKPSLVLGAGGYSSGPVVLAASLLGKPTILLEQNVRPGLTNRILRRWADRAVVSFARSLPYFKGKGLHLGNPVREEFYALPARNGRDSFGLLVFGGSQGSHVLNETIIRALPLLRNYKEQLRIVHQTGKKDFFWVKEEYARQGFTNSEVGEFFHNMPLLFSRSDLIVSRAGATTVAEIIASRKAALLVPFAQAADNHQLWNARELEKAGAAEVIEEKDLTPERLAGRIVHFLENREDLCRLQKNLEPFRTENATQKIAQLCLEMMEKKEEKRG